MTCAIRMGRWLRNLRLRRKELHGQLESGKRFHGNRAHLLQEGHCCYSKQVTVSTSDGPPPGKGVDTVYSWQLYRSASNILLLSNQVHLVTSKHCIIYETKQNFIKRILNRSGKIIQKIRCRFFFFLKQKFHCYLLQTCARTNFILCVYFYNKFMFELAWV